MFLICSTARLGHNHGYRLEGDSALLSADIELSPSASRLAASFALQLWACAEPYRGGPLSGFKVAEAPIALADVLSPARHDAVAFARPPAPTGEYAMVLVLAAGSEGAFDQVYDFANYPARQRFIVPHLTGAAGYKVHEDGSVSLHVDRVVNPRAQDNLSGTLSLQLWACEKPYAGGELQGTLLASHELGQLRGQEALSPVDLRSLLTHAVNDAAHLVLALSEWTALGYLARDYCNFVEPYRAPSEPVPSVAAVPSVEVAPSEAVPSVDAVLAVEVARPVEARGSACEQNIEAAPSAEAASSPSAEAAPIAGSVLLARGTARFDAPRAKAAPITVPTPSAKAAPLTASTKAAPSTEATSSVKATPVAKTAPSTPPSRASEAARPSLNLLSEDELAKVAGISKKLAGQVIKARPFKSFEQLASVRGIGEKTVDRLRKLLTL